MKKFFLFSIFLFQIAGLSAQNDITLKMSEMDTFGPFVPLRFFITPMRSEQPDVKQVPPELTEYRIRMATPRIYSNAEIEKLKAMDHGANTDAVEAGIRLYILIGKNADGKIVVIPDANNNLLFTDDPKFEFPVSDDPAVQAKYEKEIAPAGFELPLLYYSGSGYEEKTINLTVHPYSGSMKYEYANDVDPVDAKYALFLGAPGHMTAETAINGKDYNIYMSSALRGSSYAQQAEILIEDKKGEKADNSMAYILGDTISLDSLRYVVAEIAPWGEALKLKFTGYDRFPKGITPGYYLPYIKTASIAGDIVDFGELKGKYIVMDFWGSWCKPCIAALPRFKALYNKYKSSGCEFISIADDENVAAVKDLISQYGMEWTQIIQTPDDYEIIKRLKISSFPTVMLIGPEGKILIRGSHVLEEIDEYLSANLQK